MSETTHNEIEATIRAYIEDRRSARRALMEDARFERLRGRSSDTIGGIVQMAKDRSGPLTLADIQLLAEDTGYDDVEILQAIRRMQTRRDVARYYHKHTIL